MVRAFCRPANAGNRKNEGGAAMQIRSYRTEDCKELAELFYRSGIPV